MIPFSRRSEIVSIPRRVPTSLRHLPLQAPANKGLKVAIPLTSLAEPPAAAFLRLGATRRISSKSLILFNLAPVLGFPLTSPGFWPLGRLAPEVARNAPESPFSVIPSIERRELSCHYRILDCVDLCLKTLPPSRRPLALALGAELLLAWRRGGSISCQGATKSIQVFWRLGMAASGTIECMELSIVPRPHGTSPFDVPPVRTKATTQDILEAIRESRERG